jgi:hypothetical protein
MEDGGVMEGERPRLVMAIESGGRLASERDVREAARRAAARLEPLDPQEVFADECLRAVSRLAKEKGRWPKASLVWAAFGMCPPKRGIGSSASFFWWLRALCDEPLPLLPPWPDALLSDDPLRSLCPEDAAPCKDALHWAWEVPWA